jgi:hypothetical protein
MKKRDRGGFSRREFLKTSLLGAAALGLGPTIILPRRFALYAGGESTHPNISPLRVVGLEDPKMTTDVVPECNWQRQEELVKAEVVAENMDRLACALAQEKDPAAAWRAIFLKPAAKAWSDTVAAIKVNCIAQQRTRSAVFFKVITTLTDVLGLKGENVFVYDACHGDAITRTTGRGAWSVAQKLPKGAQAVGKWGSYNAPVTVGKPWKDGSQQAKCLDHLVQGKVDILVNVALCKGHGDEFGRFTLAMKNHFGTFDPGPSHSGGGPTNPADYVIAINKTPQILGDMDPATGKVLFPRQQLVLVDCLWASDPGPGGEATHQPNRLFMGTLPPVVDYLVATKFRRDAMGWKTNDALATRFLTEFGYQPGDLPQGGEIVNALAG